MDNSCLISEFFANCHYFSHLTDRHGSRFVGQACRKLTGVASAQGLCDLFHDKRIAAISFTLVIIVDLHHLCVLLQTGPLDLSDKNEVV